MSNAERIMPEFQELKVGDVIAYGLQGPYLPVREVLPNNVFILGDYDFIMMRKMMLQRCTKG